MTITLSFSSWCFTCFIIIGLTFQVKFVTLQRPYNNVGQHCRGDGITELMHWDHVQCSAYCDVRDDCAGYVFNVKENFTCILKPNDCQLGASDVWRFFQKPGSLLNIGGGISSNSMVAADAVEGLPLSSSNVGGGGGIGDETAAQFGSTLWSAPAEQVPEAPVSSTGVIGVGRSFTKRNYHCAGSNLGAVEEWSLRECAEACLRDSNCFGFVRLVSGEPQCILKKAGCSHEPATVWVFYERTGDTGVDFGAAAHLPLESSSSETPVNLIKENVAAAVSDPHHHPHHHHHQSQQASGQSSSSGLPDGFVDIQQHCKGGVISTEMRGHDQCARACVEVPDCIGYSIQRREPYQCYLKSKLCEMSEASPMWTFVKKRQLFKEMQSVRCIRFTDDYGVTALEHCKQLCIDRAEACIGVSFRTGSCKMISSFDCDGWQIYKRLEQESTRFENVAGGGGGGDGTSSDDGSTLFQQQESASDALQSDSSLLTGGGEAGSEVDAGAAASSPAIEDSTAVDAAIDPLTGASLNDFFFEQNNSPPETVASSDVNAGVKDDSGALYYFQKLDGNCRGGRLLAEMGGSLGQCAYRCHYLPDCRGFSFIRRDGGRCMLKAESCYAPSRVNTDVAFWQHIERA